MLDSLLSLDHAAAIAHRGGSQLRPENTVVAFDHAVALGADALECDVHLSRDNELVVIHDATLERTTNGSGPVAARTAAELAQVDAAFHFDPAGGYPFRARGIGVPRLHDVLVRYRDRPVIVEIKGEDSRTAERLVALIREHDAADRVVVGGFSYPVLEAARHGLPGLVTSASSPEARRALQRSYLWLAPWRPAFQVFQVPFKLRGRQVFGRQFGRAARRGRLPVQAWVIDEPADMRRLLEWGVTGLISDRPDLAIAAVQTYRSAC
jgi:glycerophosphoryl diester phosphodiesterase